MKSTKGSKAFFSAPSSCLRPSTPGDPARPGPATGSGPGLRVYRALILRPGVHDCRLLKGTSNRRLFHYPLVCANAYAATLVEVPQLHDRLCLFTSPYWLLWGFKDSSLCQSIFIRAVLSACSTDQCVRRFTTGTMMPKRKKHAEQRSTMGGGTKQLGGLPCRRQGRGKKWTRNVHADGVASQ